MISRSILQEVPYLQPLENMKDLWEVQLTLQKKLMLLSIACFLCGAHSKYLF